MGEAGQSGECPESAEGSRACEGGIIPQRGWMGCLREPGASALKLRNRVRILPLPPSRRIQFELRFLRLRNGKIFRRETRLSGKSCTY